jgi:hypothetical protein
MRIPCSSRAIPCSAGAKSLIARVQGFGGNALKWLHDRSPACRKARRFDNDYEDFPNVFPVGRESRPHATASRRDAIKALFTGHGVFPIRLSS